MKHAQLLVLLLLFLAALMIHYLLPVQKEYFDAPIAAASNPNLTLNVGGPSWSQYVVKRELLPSSVVLGVPFNAGSIPITPSKTIRTYGNNETYFLGDVVSYNGTNYLNLASKDDRGFAYSGSYQQSPDKDKYVWMPITVTTNPVSTPPSTKSSIMPSSITAASVQIPGSATNNGMKFSDLINSLMTSYGSKLSTPSSSKSSMNNIPKPTVPATNKTSMLDMAEDVEDIETLVHDEVQAQLQEIRKGPKDYSNAHIQYRMLNGTDTTMRPGTNSDSLQQGAWFRTSGDKSAYANSQESSSPTCSNPACPNAATSCEDTDSVPAPFNSSDYIRKDQIPCWGCKLK